MHKSIATFIEKWSHAISNQFTTSDPERAARGIILITFQAIAILTLLLFGSGLLLHRQHISLVIIDFAGAAILIGNIIYFHLTRNIRQSSYIALIAGIMLLMVLALSSTSDGSGIYWSFIFPLLAIALLGSVSGAFFSLGYLTFLILFLWLPVSLFPHFHLETLPRIRIIAVFGFIFIISILLERIRVFAQKSQVTWQKSLLNHMDNLPIGIYRGSASAGILHVNTTLAHMLGFKTPDSFFENPTSFEPAFMNKSYKEIIDSQGLLHGLERPWITPSGETIHLKEHIRTLVDNGVTTFEGTVENITERRTMEDRMSTYLYDLTVLSTSVLQFTDISDISKAYPTIINQLTALIGDAIILASSYNARKQVFQIEDFYIPETLKQNNNNLSECNPKQTPFLMHEHVLTTLRTGQLTPIQYNSHDFFSNNISAPQQEQLKALFDIGEVRLLGFSWQEEIFGKRGIHLNTPKLYYLNEHRLQITYWWG